VVARGAVTAVYGDTNHYGYFEGRRSDNRRGFYLGYGNGNDLVTLWLDSANKLNIGGGNVGIGTTNPSQKLHVRNDDTNLVFNIDQTVSDKVAIEAFNDGNTIKRDILLNPWGGNVGIGTTNPTQKLDVNGYVKGRSGLCIGNDCRSTWPSGGGDITAVYAGNGLTGGGTSGDVTLHVGAGTGISVGANTVGLRYPSKSCPSGKAIRSFNLGSSAAPTCVDVGGGGLSGSGTTNYIPKWTASTTLGNSVIYQTGNDIRISGRLGTAGRSPSCPNGWSCGVHTFDIYADGAIHANKWIETNDAICIRGDCRTSWPGGGTINYGDCRYGNTVGDDFGGTGTSYCPNGYVQVGTYLWIYHGGGDRDYVRIKSYCCRLQ